MIEFAAYASSSHGNLYRVTDGAGSSLLLECGIPMKALRKALQFKLSAIDGCLCSHSHADHSKAAKDIMAAGIDLYCSHGTAGALELSGHRLHPVQPLEQFRVGPWTVLPFETQHDAPEPLGYLIHHAVSGDKLLFAADTFYIKHRFRGLTHIVLECNYSKATLRGDMHPAQRRRLLRAHMSLETVLKFLEANDLSAVREIHLIHLSEDNSDETLFRDTVQGMTGIPVHIAKK